MSRTLLLPQERNPCSSSQLSKCSALDDTAKRLEAENARLTARAEQMSCVIRMQKQRLAVHEALDNIVVSQGSSQGFIEDGVDICCQQKICRVGVRVNKSKTYRQALHRSSADRCTSWRGEQIPFWEIHGDSVGGPRM